MVAALLLGAAAVLGLGGGASHAAEAPLRVALRGVKPVYPVSEDIKLKPQVSGAGPQAKHTYRWTSLEGPPLNEWATTAEELVIPQTDLRSGAVYKLRLDVEAEWLDPRTKKIVVRRGSAEISFRINAAPFGGRCMVEASRVGKQKAVVRASAPDWRDDEQLPIHYRFTILRNGEQVHERSWSGAAAAQISLDVEPGDRLQAECFIRDRHKAETSRLSSVLSS